MEDAFAAGRLLFSPDQKSTTGDGAARSKLRKTSHTLDLAMRWAEAVRGLKECSIDIVSTGMVTQVDFRVGSRKGVL